MIYSPPPDDLASRLGVIYKYRKISSPEEFRQALAMIKYKSLWFWHLTGQNDENECNPKVIFGGGYGARYKYFKDDFKSAYPDWSMKIIKEKASRAAKKPRIPRSVDVYKKWTVCCFSAKANDVDLWHRYGGGGSGIVLAYEAKKDSSIGMAAKVKYKDEKVVLDILRLDEEKSYEIFTTKQKKWECEEEYRMVERLDVPFSGKDIVYPDVNILSIRLGERLEDHYRTDIIDLCQNLNISII
ncbi:MAG: DUF2971 domain-containing protein [Chlorobiaceae bacterium]|nr:DUF2971 domain-containing protein [Chlorobiaceae bacterium]